MKEIQLTQGKVTLVDDDDYNDLLEYTWCAFSGTQTFYAYNSKNRIFLHDLILPHHPWLIVDHIDGNGLNNQHSNLRTCSHQDNNRNREKRKGLSSLYKGVSYDKVTKTWKSYITMNGKAKHLGRFSTEIEAAINYDIAALNHFGPFAKLNFNLGEENGNNAGTSR